MTKFFEKIHAKEISIGRGVVIEEGASISDPERPMERLVIGDYVTISANCKFRVPHLEIGDYTQIHAYTLANGYAPLTIGHNGWVGQNCILNATDRLQIGNNFGVGAYSQLWTHIAYGDVLDGCRWDSTNPMVIGNDVWFVGHCVVSPIVAEDRSMALLGSLITKNMEAGRVYAGSPARDVTEKVGPQFGHITIDQKIEKFMNMLKKFFVNNNDFDISKIGFSADGTVIQDGETIFDLSTRTYNKHHSNEEVAFMRFILPRAKFTPEEK